MSTTESSTVNEASGQRQLIMEDFDPALVPEVVMVRQGDKVCFVQGGPTDLNESLDENMQLVESIDQLVLEERVVNGQTVSSVKDGKWVVEGPYQRSDVKNANQRFYPRALWERLISNTGSSVQQCLKARGMLGHLEHPADGRGHLKEGALLTTELTLRPDGVVWGRSEILDNPNGLILQELCAKNIRWGVSSRGSGSIGPDGKVNETDYSLSSFDAVSAPSTPGAYPTRVQEDDAAGDVDAVNETDAQQPSDFMHTTATSRPSKIIGVTLKDEGPKHTGVYMTGHDGKLWPARTVSRTPKKHHRSVVAAWIAGHGLAADHRKVKDAVTSPNETFDEAVEQIEEAFEGSFTPGSQWGSDRHAGVTYHAGPRNRTFGGWYQHVTVKHNGTDIGHIQTRRKNKRTEVHTASHFGGAVRGQDVDFLMHAHRSATDPKFREDQHVAALKGSGAFIRTKPDGSKETLFGDHPDFDKEVRASYRKHNGIKESSIDALNEAAAKPYSKIMPGGAGGFLNPPGHPAHHFHVAHYARNNREVGSSSLESYAASTGVGAASGRLKRWEREKLPLSHPDVQDWVHQVHGYFKGMYKGHVALHGEEKAWHASNLIHDPSRDPTQHVDTHAGTHHIKKYYPEYTPTAADHANAYWGQKTVKEEIEAGGPISLLSNEEFMPTNELQEAARQYISECRAMIDETPNSEMAAKLKALMDRGNDLETSGSLPPSVRYDISGWLKKKLQETTETGGKNESTTPNKQTAAFRRVVAGLQQKVQVREEALQQTQDALAQAQAQLAEQSQQVQETTVRLSNVVTQRAQALEAAQQFKQQLNAAQEQLQSVSKQLSAARGALVQASESQVANPQEQAVAALLESTPALQPFKQALVRTANPQELKQLTEQLMPLLAAPLTKRGTRPSYLPLHEHVVSEPAAGSKVSKAPSNQDAALAARAIKGMGNPR